MVCGEGCRALVPSECPPFCSTSPHLPSVTHLKPPWMPYYAVCVEAPSHRQDLFLSPFSAMLPSQENCGGGAENPKHLIMACSFQWPFLSQDPPRVALLERKTLLSSSKWKGFQELCQGWGQRPNIRTKDVPSTLWHGPFLKSLLNSLQYCFCFTFCFVLFCFWLQGMQDLSSLTWDRTSVPCTRRWSVNHWTTREVLCLHSNHLRNYQGLKSSVPGPVIS